MKFNICTYFNEFGLGKDRRLISDLLRGWGHEIREVNIADIEGRILNDQMAEADVNIFLELLSPLVVNANIAKQNWFIPNQEWYHGAWDSILPRMDKILCKTQEAVRVFGEKGCGSKCVLTGWESTDLYDSSVPRKRQFLHVAGGSAHKNTLGVCYAFAKFFHNPYNGPWNKGMNIPFILVSCDNNHANQLINRPNCKSYERISDEEMKRLMNESIFHVMPSGAEGWGHVIHEGLSCGAVMVTTDFPPMNEYAGIDKSLLAHSSKWEPMNQIGRLAWVGAYDVKTAIENAWRLPPERVEQIQTDARAAFLTQRESFRQRFKELVDAV